MVHRWEGVGPPFTLKIAVPYRRICWQLSWQTGRLAATYSFCLAFQNAGRGGVHSLSCREDLHTAMGMALPEQRAEPQQQMAVHICFAGEEVVCFLGMLKKYIFIKAVLKITSKKKRLLQCQCCKCSCGVIILLKQ